MGSVRVHFTAADLARTHVVAQPDPIWELVLSVHVLMGENPRRTFPEWRRTLPNGEQRDELRRIVRVLVAPLAPPGPYFPDFMTPIESGAGFEFGLEAIARTPRRRVRRELAMIRPLPGSGGWLAAVAEGRAVTWSVVTSALRTYFDRALRPFWPTISARVESEYLRRGRLRVASGVDGMLASLGPVLRWDPPVLTVEGPSDRDVLLNGRGLTIIPSYFATGHPIMIFDPELPQIVLFPAAPSGTAPVVPSRALADLLGPTRAAALQAIARGCTTSELAATLGVSVSTASEHASVLRRAGQITTARRGHAVWHALTPLGFALLQGASG